MGVKDTLIENGCLIRTLSCWQGGVSLLCVGSGAIWLVSQRPEHIPRYAPIEFLGGTAGSAWNESMTAGLNDPLGWNVTTVPAKTATYNAPHSGGPFCRLQAAACSPVTADAVAGTGTGHLLMTGPLFVGSDVSPEIASTLVLPLIAAEATNIGGLWFHFQTWCCYSLQAPMAFSFVQTEPSSSS
jgi:hypothetical protein